MDLLDYRNKIDEIDYQLVSLLRQRLAVARQIADYKAEHRLAVTDRQREQALLQRLAMTSEEDADAVLAVYEAILKTSRAVQQKRIKGDE